MSTGAVLLLVHLASCQLTIDIDTIGAVNAIDIDASHSSFDQSNQKLA